MKHTSKLFILMSLLLFISACKAIPEKSTSVIDNPENTDLKTYLKEVDLPNHFSITFNPETILIKQEASIYTASLLEIDENKAIEVLLQGDVVEAGNYAEGPMFKTVGETFQEYLYVYDGGESFGINSGVHGGLNYTLSIHEHHDANKQQMVIANEPGPPDNIAQLFGYNLKSDYQPRTNLSFKSYDQTLENIENILYDSGFPTVEVAETYSVDLDTMLRHYDIYLDSRSYFGDEEGNDNVTFTKDDEFYFYFFRQMIDDIPLSNINWKNETNINEITATTMNVVYTKDGVRSLHANNFLHIKEKGNKEQLISEVTALHSVIEAYSDILLEDDISLFSMELNYVAILKSDNHYELIPAWIFGTAETIEWTDESNGTNYTSDDYSYHVINAITGDKIESAGDL